MTPTSAPENTTEPQPKHRPARPKEAQEGKGGRKGFSMALINFWLDAVILVALVLYGWITAIVRFVFPIPSRTAGWKLWGLNYDQWFDIQFYCICVFAVGVLIHVMLHWNWVCSVVANQVMHKKRPDEGMQTIYGVVFLIALLHVLGVGLLVALLTVQRPPVP